MEQVEPTRSLARSIPFPPLSSRERELLRLRSVHQLRLCVPVCLLVHGANAGHVGFTWERLRGLYQ